MNVLVTGIITTYNRELSVLQRAINSICNQTYKNIEIIIVNDCPENKELCEDIFKYIKSLNDSRIRYIVHKENLGACCVRNTGIKASHGDYIGFLDDDDEWINTKIEKQLSVFHGERVGAVYCYYYNIATNLKKDKIIPCSENGILVDKLLRGNCIGGTSMPLIKKEVFNEVGVFDEKLLSSQDHDMWLRIAKKYEFACCKDYLVNRFMQSESITKNITKQKSGFEAFINKNMDLYENNPEALNFLLNQKAKQWFVSGYYSESIFLYRKAVSTKFFSMQNIFVPAKAIILWCKNKIN